jgi:hypothetical protein
MSATTRWATNTWTVVARSPLHRQLLTGLPGRSKVYIYGDTSTAGFTGLWSYDMATTTWVQETPGGAPPATTGIWAPAWAFDAETGYCYMTGGATVAGAGNLTTVNVYDPATNAWLAPLPNFTTVRDFHAAWVFTDSTRASCCAWPVATAAPPCQHPVLRLRGGHSKENADIGPLPADLWAGYAQKEHEGVTQPG